MGVVGYKTGPSDLCVGKIGWTMVEVPGRLGSFWGWATAGAGDWMPAPVIGCVQIAKTPSCPGLQKWDSRICCC